ncbi:MAG: metal ABC transporter ATP-binding protein [Phycisphaerae bacterium]
MSHEPVIELQGVTFAYDATPVLRGASLLIPGGDFACFVGPNGGGKTTLLKLVLGLIEPREGSVRVLGVEPKAARRRIGYMPQHAHLDPSFPVTAMDVVLMGRLGCGLPFGRYGKRDREIAAKALADVNLSDMHARSYAAMSGGQRQRVLIARALASEPDLLLLDEPTANLDINVEEQLYALLRELNQRLTIVMVSHDLGFVSKHVKTAVCVNRTVHTHAVGDLTGDVIQNLYGREIKLVQHEAPSMVQLTRRGGT